MDTLTCSSPIDASSTDHDRMTRAKRRRIAGLASITVTFLATSSAPTPLYTTYQSQWGFSDQMVTMVFGVYALALLVTLLSAGRLSDHLGRRRVILVGIVVQILAVATYVDAHSVTTLLVARVIQGVATGVTLGAVGAAMLDIDARSGAVANSTAPGVGTASGAVISSFTVQWLPAPTRLIYLIFVGILVTQLLWVTRLPETSPRHRGAWGSMIPQLTIPLQTRRPLLSAAPVLFAVWALAGFFGSLGPSLIAQLVHSQSVVAGGAGLGVLAGVAAVTTYVLRQWPATRVMVTGTLALSAGVAVVILGVATSSWVVFFAGTTISGVGFGAGFQGGMRLVAPLAHPDQRAGVLAVLYMISYLAMGVPAVLAGTAVVHGVGLAHTSYFYLAGVIVLSVVAFVKLVTMTKLPSTPVRSIQQSREANTR
ncbi:MAG TPA: MFS transporter [Acidimicrobiales bacterium]